METKWKASKWKIVYIITGADTNEGELSMEVDKICAQYCYILPEKAEKKETLKSKKRKWKYALLSSRVLLVVMNF